MSALCDILLPITVCLGNCQMNQLKTHAMFQEVYQAVQKQLAFVQASSFKLSVRQLRQHVSSWVLHEA